MKAITPPTSVTSSADETILQLWELLNRETAELTDRYSWDWNHEIATFPHANTNGANLVIKRTAFSPKMTYMIRGTLWTVATRLPVSGPLSSEAWQAMIQLQVAPAQYSFRFIADWLAIYPYTAGVTFNIEYETDESCVYYAPSAPTTPVYSNTWNNDTTTCLFPDRIIEAGLLWRWKAEKGLPYGEDQRSYESLVARAYANDGNSSEIRITDDASYPQAVRPGLLIPAGNWNV